MIGYIRLSRPALIMPARCASIEAVGEHAVRITQQSQQREAPPAVFGKTAGDETSIREQGDGVRLAAVAVEDVAAAGRAASNARSGAPL